MSMSTSKKTPLHVNTATGGAAITANDSTDLPEVYSGLYIGGAGNLKVDLLDGSTVTFTGLLVGTIYPFTVKRVYATGTTATNIIGLKW